MNALETNVGKLLTNVLEEAIERLKKGDSFYAVERLSVRQFGAIARAARSEQLTSLYLALMFLAGPFDSYVSDMLREELKKGELLKKRLLEEKESDEGKLSEGELVAVIKMFDDVGDVTDILTTTGEIDEESLRGILNLEIFSAEKRDHIFWEVVYAIKQELPNLQKRASAELNAIYQGAIESLSEGIDALFKFIVDETVKFHLLTAEWIKPK